MSLSRTTRGLGLAAAAILTTAALTSCSTGNEAPEAGGSGDTTSDSCVIGMTQINQTAVFFTEMNAGATEAAEKLGCELNITNANNDSARQSSDIENFVTQGVDALIVVAIDVNGVKPAVTAAQAAGIPVIAIDAEVEGVDTFVGVDNEAAGAEAAAWAIEEGLIDGMSYGVVDAKSSFIQNQREDSFRTAIDAAGAKYTQSVNGDNVQEKAATAAQDLVTAQPDLDFIYTTGEPATVGAVAALSGGSTETTIIGWDLTAEVIAGIDSGLVRAVIQQDPRQEGVEAVTEIVAILGGDEPRGFIDVPITFVTSDNVDDFREIFN
ncbi:substrate-binding domain-containing protein [Leucobacter luti]|uniref:Monosaccharide ABC transporter substrate-binding protein (CUT2 family) n=1 Tax=Leucobacter luti TaxID=340320 RepID=A0A4Q7U6J9_9MICO|nr:substrate-binding domain-containing protein [Leucobacter luti]MBL3700469.1 sugar ABC transporter substrate-binding protein [Leucobacter luti]RZT68697.1 monosaccharide ABC transporter substrate-binding protein (CUT2 family) [Leucobacter luti]